MTRNLTALTALLALTSCSSSSDKNDASIPDVASDIKLADTILVDMPAGTTWAFSAGGAGNDKGYGVAVDGQGEIYVAGYFSGTASFGSTTLTAPGGGSAGFVARLDPDGKPRWAVALGEGMANHVALDGKGGVYVTGLFRGTASLGSTTLTASGEEDVFVVKLDETGKILWSASAGGALTDEATRIAVDAAGNSTITGTFSGAASFGTTTLVSESGPPAPDGGAQDQGGVPPPPPPPPDDAGVTDAGASSLLNTFVARLDATGAFLWAVAATPQFAEGLAVDAAGNSTVTGYFLGGGARFGTLSRTLSSPSAGLYVARLDTSGGFLWANVAEKAMGQAVAVDGAGNAYVTGTCMGAAKLGTLALSCTAIGLFAAKLDSAGQFLWASASGGAGVVTGEAIARDNADHLYVAGDCHGDAAFGTQTVTNKGSNDACVAELDENGAFLWAASGGGASNDAGRGVAVDSAGRIIVTGYFGNTAGGSATFGPSTLQSQGKADIYVWRPR